MIELLNVSVRDDEPVQEMVVVERDNGDFVTQLKVIRGYEYVTATINHGPSEAFSGKIPPLFMAPQGAECVGLMLQMSEEHRHDLRYWRMAIEQQEASTLIPDVIRQEEAALLDIKNQSTFGPHVVKQRGGHNHTQVVRDFMDDRAEKLGKRQFPT